MAISDYNSLATAIKTWCARTTSTAFNNQIETFVSLAEQRMWNGSGSGPSDPLFCDALNAPELETEATVTMVAGVGTLPSDVSTLRLIKRDGDTVGLDYLPPKQWAIRDNLPTGITDQPAYYTIEQNVTLKVTPSYDGDLTILYYKRDTAVSSVNTTSTTLTTYPMLYLSGCLFEAFSFMQEEALAMGHFARYRAILSGINSSIASVRYGGGPLKVRPRSRMP
jgi:hypothetical protein